MRFNVLICKQIAEEKEIGKEIRNSVAKKKKQSSQRMHRLMSFHFRDATSQTCNSSIIIMVFMHLIPKWGGEEENADNNKTKWGVVSHNDEQENTRYEKRT